VANAFYGNEAHDQSGSEIGPQLAVIGTITISL